MEFQKLVRQLEDKLARQLRAAEDTRQLLEATKALMARVPK